MRYGCAVCSSADAKDSQEERKASPQEPIQIVMGDKNYPTDIRSEYTANRVVDAIRSHRHYSKILIVVGSYNFFPVLSRSLRLYGNKFLLAESQKQVYDYLGLNQKFLEYLRNIKDVNIFLHQTAILEVMHGQIESDNLKETFREGSQLQLNNILLLEYHSLLQKYKMIYCYDYLAKPEL